MTSMNGILERHDRIATLADFLRSFLFFFHYNYLFQHALKRYFTMKLDTSQYVSIILYISTDVEIYDLSEM